MNVLDTLDIKQYELNYYNSLDTINEKIQYFFEIYEIDYFANNTSVLNNLQTYFKDIEESLKENDISLTNSNNENIHPVDVVVDEDHIVLQSSNLKALRLIRDRFFDDGYILFRNLPLEKEYKKVKNMKYLRCYSILGETYNSISLN